jgi:hypothetical protein
MAVTRISVWQVSLKKKPLLYPNYFGKKEVLQLFYFRQKE